MNPITPTREIDTLIRYLTTSSTKRRPLEGRSIQSFPFTFQQQVGFLSPQNPSELFISSGELSEQEVIEELTRRVVEGELNYIGPKTLVAPGGHEIENWRGYRALMLAFMYSRSEERTISILQDRITTLTNNDDLPFFSNDPEYNKAFEIIIRDWKKIDDIFKGFHHLAFATRNDGISEYSMFERYIRQVNRKENYTAYKPTGNSSNNDFPGAGFAVNGIHSKVNRYLERELWHGIKEGEADFITAQKLYREALVNGEEYLKDTTFLFFRGFIAVFNEKEMIIDGKPHALIIFNEHFQNENLRMAYIIPIEKINQFLRNPYKAVNEKNILYPSKIEDRFFNIAIDPTSITVLSGYDKAFPSASDHYPFSIFYDKQGAPIIRPLFRHEQVYDRETCDVKNKMHRTHMFGGYWTDINPENYSPYQRAHKEVARCLEFGLSQIDLFLDGFRLYNMGFNYDEKSKSWDLKSKRLLNQATRWHQSPKIKEEKDRPILVPVPRLTYSQLDPELLKEGFLDTSSMQYCRVDEKGTIEIRELDEIRKIWRLYVSRMYNNNADLTFTSGEEMRETISRTL